MLELKGPFAVVVVQGVPREVVKGVGFFGVTGFLANDEGQFDFPIRFVPVAGKDQVVVGAAKGRGGFEEDDRLFGNLHTRLLGVVHVVQSDADDLARPGNGRTIALTLRE